MQIECYLNLSKYYFLSQIVSQPKITHAVPVSNTLKNWNWHEMHLPRILLVFSLWYSKPIPLLLIAKLDQSSADINTLPAKTCTTEERPWRKNENTQTVPCWHFLPFLSQIAGCNLYSARIHTSKQVQAGALLNFFSLFPLDQQHWCAKATSPKVLDCLPQHLLPMSLYFSLLPNNFRSEVF